MLTQVIGYVCYIKNGKMLGPVFVGEGQGKVYFLDLEEGEMFEFEKDKHSLGKI